MGYPIVGWFVKENPNLNWMIKYPYKDHQYGLMVYKSIFQEISLLLNIVIYLVSIPHCENQLYLYFRKPPFGRANSAVPSMFQ